MPTKGNECHTGCKVTNNFRKAMKICPDIWNHGGGSWLKQSLGQPLLRNAKCWKNDRHFRRQESAMGEICQDALFSLFSIVTTSVCIGGEYEWENYWQYFCGFLCEFVATQAGVLRQIGDIAMKYVAKGTLLRFLGEIFGGLGDFDYFCTQNN